ncbi:MarR family winged helix-turn-helix transcriptional regulator [Anaerofustis sp. NSJ-163]|uniref:MarR family winged helix-turn-helix transcriptional regulator n=1 Tax=Anaerofustis sp. NSJ-163 TaxID=2944391 RepID=UPI00209BE6FF|nr:MarR family winged helix-turn-helix transcriptional regulator [Anaerofustis sp. NSJ-163]MCO8193708.1 MarR family winged helix-turn-helix transcriptional regulator [Anaerofustis sp. NSJ-163]
MYLTNIEKVLKHFANIRKVYAKAFTNMLEDDSFSPNEINILIFLNNNPTKNTSKELCKYLDVSKGLVCRSIDSLLKKDLIKIKPDNTDKRVQHIILANKSNEIIKQILNAKDEIDKIILKEISIEEINQMEKTIKKILNIFEERAKNYEDKNV